MCYTPSNFEIRCDVTAYLRRVTIQFMCSMWNRGKPYGFAVKYTIYRM